MDQPDSVYVVFRQQLPAVKVTYEDASLQLEEQLNQQVGQEKKNWKPYTVILDECDRVLDDACQQLLEELLLSKGVGRVIIFSRFLNRCLLNEPKLRALTQIVPVDKDHMLWDYTALDDNDNTLVEVRALGMGSVSIDGEPIRVWEGLLPRLLFYYLVDRGMVTRNDIFQTFWPNLTVQEATNVFHVTKKKIGDILGINLTVFVSGFYHIGSNIILSYDVNTFSQMVQDSAVLAPQDELKHLRSALRLYRGEFLADQKLQWIHKRRQDVNQTFSDALFALGKAYESQGETRHALNSYLTAGARNRVREDVVYHAMRLYKDIGMPRDAAVLYQRLSEDLQREMNMKPSDYFKNLLDD
jgi:DNA-binding SARP family transcriptional activator